MSKIKSHINRQIVHYAVVFIAGLFLALWFSFILPYIASEVISRQNIAEFTKAPNADAATVFSRVQYASGEGNPAAATFAATPISGNLLVAIAMHRVATAGSAFTITGNGWTKRVARDTLPSDPQARRSLAIWTKVAGDSEPTDIQVDNGTSDTIKLLIQEFSAGASVTWTFEGQSSADTGTNSTSPLSTGSTLNIGAGDLLLIGSAIWRNGSSAPGNIGWTSGIGTMAEDSGGKNGRTINTGFVQDSSGGAKTASVSWTGAGHEATAAIIVFSAVDNVALTLPLLSLPTSGNVTATSADMGATIDSDGNATITERGTCWGTSPAPTGNCLVEGGIGVGIFSHNRTGLPSSTTIYYRGYAVNSVGRGYSPDALFSTPSVPPPTVDLNGWSTSGTAGNGPISITYGNSVTLEWSSTDATQCVASGGWSGNKATSPGIQTEIINNVTVDTTFTLNCTNITGFDVDSFTANILKASLSASLTSGMVPMNDVDLTATTDGISGGTYRYFFDCKNTSPVIDTGDTATNPYTEISACSYTIANNYNPTVTIWHSEGIATATIQVNVSANALPTITNVSNDGPVEEGQVITFDVDWTDAEGIINGYLVVCKDPDTTGAPLDNTWPPQCQNGYWNDAPVAVSGTGATTQIQYTTITNDADTGINGWAYVCQKINECSPQTVFANTVFTINVPASEDDLIAINLSVPASTYNVNDPFKYTLKITNNGFNDSVQAANVVVQVTLPNEVAIASPLPPPSCTPALSVGDMGVSVSCDIGSIPIFGSKQEFFNVIAKVEKVSVAKAILTNSSPEDNDPPPGVSSNNTDYAVVTIADPLAVPNAIPILNNQYRGGGSFIAGPQVFWDDSIASAADLDVTVSGEATIALADPIIASGTLVSRPIDSRAANGVAPIKISFWGDLPDTERDPAFFLRNAMYNPTTGLIDTNCEDLPGNAPYNDNCTTDLVGNPTGEPSGEWRVGVDFMSGRYGGQITAPAIDPQLDGTGQGWAWSDSVGWIAFSCDTPTFNSSGNPTGFAGDCALQGDWAVQEDTLVPLAANRPVTGWAWSPVIGWVAFGCDAPGLVGACGPNWDRGDGNDTSFGNDSVYVDENGIYHGWAWSSMVGWISMNCNESPVPYNVCAANGQPLARSASGGYSQVQVKIAASNCPHAEIDPPSCEIPGTWAYSAPYTFDDIGNIGNGNFEINLMDSLATLWNTRYVRYQMTLCSFPNCGVLGTPNTPTVKGVSVLWAP